MARDTTVLLLGGSGQVGAALRTALEGRVQLDVPSRRDVDLRDTASIERAIASGDPDVVINAAAYTAVDRAESARDEAYAVNAEGPERLALACARDDRWLVHLSTDYVFDGRKRSPYVEDDATAPLNVYGASKLAGEHAVRAAGGHHIILRLSWVYAAGGQNFVETIRRLARERQRLEIVDDQQGAPTSARAVARAIATIVPRLQRPRGAQPSSASGPGSGTFHLSAGGVTSWFDFARQICANDPRRAEHRCVDIAPVTSSDHGAPARRPLWSVMDNTRIHERFGIRLPAWDTLWSDEVAHLR